MGHSQPSRLTEFFEETPHDASTFKGREACSHISKRVMAHKAFILPLFMPMDLSC